MITRSILQVGAIGVINTDEKLKAPIADLKSTLDTAMDSMRKSVHDLYDESVDLRQALAKLKPTDSAIAKEAVNNAVKHSNGDEIRIIVREHPAFYQLEIMDNGTSADERSLTGETGDGIGIKNIKERVAAIGGTIEVSAVGDSGQQAVKLYEEHMPDVMLMDIRMQGMTGLEAAEKILGKYPDTKILLLTTFSDDEYIVKAISLGAKGYILKQAFESIAPALRAVNNGQTVFGTQIMDRIPHLFGADGKASSGTGQARFIDAMKSYDISGKELSIIELVAEGLNNKEIADELYLSEGTVRNYISVILEKLQLRDRTQLACFYYKSMV